MNAEELLGQEVGGYRLIEVLGKGGSGAVFKGVHEGITEPRAIKVLLLAPETTPEDRAACQLKRKCYQRVVGEHGSLI